MENYYCKDIQFECPHCGGKQSVKTVLNNGEADTSDYSEIVYPDGFNPFDITKSDKISIPYTCHCEACEKRFTVYLVCRCIGVDVFSDDGIRTYIDSFDTVQNRG